MDLCTGLLGPEKCVKTKLFELGNLGLNSRTFNLEVSMYLETTEQPIIIM
jgi:hypothetical protein